MDLAFRVLERMKRALEADLPQGQKLPLAFPAGSWEMPLVTVADGSMEREPQSGAEVHTAERKMGSSHPEPLRMPAIHEDDCSGQGAAEGHGRSFVCRERANLGSGKAAALPMADIQGWMETLPGTASAGRMPSGSGMNPESGRASATSNEGRASEDMNLITAPMSNWDGELTASADMPGPAANGGDGAVKRVSSGGGWNIGGVAAGLGGTARRMIESVVSSSLSLSVITGKSTRVVPSEGVPGEGAEERVLSHIVDQPRPSAFGTVVQQQAPPYKAAVGQYARIIALDHGRYRCEGSPPGMKGNQVLNVLRKYE